MHIGLGLQFNNLDGKTSDLEVYRRELDLAGSAEEAGFDSVWASEHHFSDYQLTSSTPMVLSWLARTDQPGQAGSDGDSTALARPGAGSGELLGAGSSLRWTDDYGNRSRPGTGEFEGFRVAMGESRRRFTEYTEAILEALETGYIEHDGDLYQQPRTPIRPRPFSSFKGRTFASAVSPQSMELMARLGVGLMVIAQKPWSTAEEELAVYRERYLELNGFEAPKPILVVVAGVSRDPREAGRMREVYLQRWARSTVEHYEFDNVGFAQIEGYEYYGALASNIAKHGLEHFNGFLADLQVWGTPDQVTEKLLDYAKRSDAAGLVVPLCFGGMDADEGRACFDVFAEDVLPVLQRYDAGGDIGVTYDGSTRRESSAG